MNTAARLGLYGAGLAVIFAGALGAGSALGQVGPAAGPARQATVPAGQATVGPKSHADMAAPADKDSAADTTHDTTAGHADENGERDEQGEHGGHGEAAHNESDTPGGLQVSQNGYTLTPRPRPSARRRPTSGSTITGPDGRPVTALRVAARQEAALHRRLPRPGPASSTCTRAGRRRRLVGPADAARAPAPTGRSPTSPPTGGGHADPGRRPARPRRLRARRRCRRPSRTATVDGYTVTLDGDLVARARRASSP